MIRGVYLRRLQPTINYTGSFISARILQVLEFLNDKPCLGIDF